MNPPKRVPANGFYYHYKHDVDGPINNYAYEVIGVGAHTETDGEFFVLYRPLYESSVYKAGKLFDLRPLEMWMGTVEKDGQSTPRFSKIEDPTVIAELQQVKQEMYGD